MPRIKKYEDVEYDDPPQGTYMDHYIAQKLLLPRRMWDEIERLAGLSNRPVGDVATLMLEAGLDKVKHQLNPQTCHCGETEPCLGGAH